MTTHDHTKLKQAVEALHDELAGLDPADSEVRTLLAEALNDLQATLARQQSGAAPAPSEEGLTARLAASAREFEESHPQLSGLLGSVIDALSRMGI